MLSSLLKSLKSLTIRKRISIELPHETMMTLSFIESGCLAASLNNKTVFVLKGSHNDIESIKKTSQILFWFECIKRPEFPSVRIYFDLKDKSNEPRVFEYFFNIESDEDMNLLGKLKEQDYFDIFFFDSDNAHSKRIKITEKDKEKIKKVIDQAID